MENNALSLIIHHLFTECFSWVPHFIICSAESLDSTASWNDSNAIKMHCQKSWNCSQIPWCKTFKGVYCFPVQMGFSLQGTLILSGSGWRYHFQHCSVLVLTANSGYPETHHMAESFVDRICKTVVVGVMGHLYSFFISCSLWVRSLSITSRSSRLHVRGWCASRKQNCFHCWSKHTALGSALNAELEGDE